MKAKARIILGSIAFMAFCLALRASATPITNIVNNGGFETGNFSGWTQGGNTSDTGVSSVAHSGNFGAYMGPVETTGTLSQNLSTLAGANYELSFFMFGEEESTERAPSFFNGFSTMVFQVFWGGVKIFDNTAPPSDWEQFTFSLVASGPTTELKFVFRNDPGFFHLDDVVAGLAAVPETLSTLWLALPALAMLGFAQFRRKSA